MNYFRFYALAAASSELQNRVVACLRHDGFAAHVDSGFLVTNASRQGIALSCGSSAIISTNSYAFCTRCHEPHLVGSACGNVGA
jgi:hypothetical protein